MVKLVNKKQPDQKRLAVFLDGTWNSVVDNTNVWRAKALCSPVGDDGRQQLVYYDIGVNGFWGGAFGKGLSENITDAYAWLVGNYSPSDEIYIFGYSRGAYTARSLAGLIAKYGLIKPGSPLGVGQVYERYRRRADKTVWKLNALKEENQLTDTSVEERWLLNHSMPIAIKMVAVWDTVGSVGIPFFSFEGISRSTLKFFHTGLRVPIEHGFHALAIDEHRKSFSPTLWSARRGIKATPRPLDSVEQRWFLGTHGNVGGGYHSDLLVQKPLRWIIEKAQGLGLSFKHEIDLETDIAAAPIADSYKDFMGGVYSWVSPRHYRTIADEPWENEHGVHETVNETIDVSVFERWQKNAGYRPPNLQEWAERKGVDLSKISSSVLAIDPSKEIE